MSHVPPPKGPPWWRPFARRRWRRALELPADLPRRLATQVGLWARDYGLERAGECSASHLVLPGGQLVPMKYAHRDVAADERAIFVAAVRMLSEIRMSPGPGPGRVWTFPGLEIVHPIYDDGMLVRLSDTNQPFVMMRAAYCHEADAYTPAPPPELD